MDRPAWLCAHSSVFPSRAQAACGIVSRVSLGLGFCRRRGLQESG